MSAQDIVRLLDEAAASMKSDVRGAVAKLESAHGLAVATGNPENIAIVSEDLARGWARRKSESRSLHYAMKATKLMPEREAAWPPRSRRTPKTSAGSRSSPGTPAVTRSQPRGASDALCYSWIARSEAA